MKTWRGLIAGIGILAALGVAHIRPAVAGEGPQTRCPVRKEAIDKRVYTDYQGKRIYFCCPPCVEQFNKNPDIYLKQMEEEGVILEPVPTKKP